MRTIIATLLSACLVAILPAGAARAALTQVNVRIEGRGKALFEGPIPQTEGHDVSSYKADGGAEDLAEHPCDGINPNDPENKTPGATPTAASVDAMDLIGEADALAGRYSPSYEDYYVTQWGDEEENAEPETGSKSWGLLVNNAFASVGGCQLELSAGDEVLWIYNAFKSRPILGLFAASEHYGSGIRPLTAQAQLGRPFEVEVAAYDGEGKPPATPERTAKDSKPYEGATVAPVSTSEVGFETVQTASPEAVVTDSEGKASITFTTPGWHRIMAGAPLEAGEETAIRSNRLDVCVPATGEPGCGAPPAEDEVRTPPRYQQREETHSGEVSTAGLQSAGGRAGGAPDSTAVAKTPGSNARLAGASVTPARVVLKLTAAGTATVRIARWVREGHRYDWRAFKRITVQARGAGEIAVRLPRLAPARYLVTISVPGSGEVVKMLTVPRGGR